VINVADIIPAIMKIYWENLRTDPNDILKSLPAPTDGPYKPTWDSLKNYRVPKWFSDSKLGIFIHWGPYSVPAYSNEWYPRHMYDTTRPEHEYHIKTYGPLTEFGYKDFIPMFTAENWDPDEWAKIFEKAGAKFVLFVAEHHDGYALWDSSYTRWCAARIGPKRDIVKELKIAVENRGLIFGVSYHRAEHWFYFEPGMRIESDVKDPKYYDLYGPAKPASQEPRAPPGPDNIPPDRQFLNDWILRLVELVEKYRPWLVYFDWWIANPVFEPYLKAFAAYYYNRCYRWGIEPVLIYKWGAYPEGTAVSDSERGTRRDIQPMPWSADTSVTYRGWGYVKDGEYKPPEQIISHMLDVVSKNGVFILNIGPKPDGTLAEEQMKILNNVGEWMKLYSEAVYGTKPWSVYGEGPTDIYKVKEKEFNLTSEDVRYTVRDLYPLGKAIYASILGKPQDTVKLRALGRNMRLVRGEIIDVALLSNKEKIAWEWTNEALVVKLPTTDVRYPISLRVLVKEH